MESKKEGKFCITCKELKPYSKFHKNRATNDGYQNICKICRKRYSDSNKAKKAVYDKVRYASLDKEVRSLKRREYYLSNRGHHLAKMRKYYENNKDSINSNNKKNANSNAIYLDTFEKLTVEELPRLSEDGVSLEVKCRYCGKYFIPTKAYINRRINSLKGVSKWEGALYCSDGCKLACPIYGRHKLPKGFKKASSREVQADLRKLVLERDYWICRKCNKSIKEVELHCHHILPNNESPIEAADVDNCITLCRDCHYKAHNVPGCGFNELKCSKL